MTESSSSELGGKDVASLADGERLIRDAFEQARASGKKDWQIMRSPVLKNRILQLDDAFDEQSWGVDSFSQFLARYPNLVEVDRSLRPPLVALRDASADPGELQSAGQLPAWGSSRLRIRPDLWSAIMDVDSADGYYWDGSEARRGKGSGENKLPTVTAEDLRGWRADFVSAVMQDVKGSPPAEQRLRRWQDEPVSSRTLPQSLRGRWMGTLKKHVQERLETWFTDHHIEVPNDLVMGQASPPVVRDTDTEYLRRMVIRAVEDMTRADLEELRLPARTLFGRRPR